MGEYLDIPEDVNELYNSFLDNNKLRRTEERTAILREICISDGHLDIDLLYDRFHNTKYRLSKATLYNTLELFVDAGIIIRHQVSSRAKSEYELRKRAEMHTHLVCRKCGRLQELRLNTALFINSVSSLASKFTPDYFSIYVYGTCAKCKKAAK